MFCDQAPIWKFLANHNLDTYSTERTNIYETYPALAMISLGWLTHDHRAKGRTTGSLPKYNPKNRNFSLNDWQMVRSKTLEDLTNCHLLRVDEVAADIKLERPNKSDQDKLDACICLLVGLHFWQ